MNEFKITHEHIKNGSRNDPSCCPIALAMRDQVHDQTRVQRGHLCCPIHLNDWCKQKKITIYSFSNRLRRWVDSFDMAKEVSEITLVLNKNKFYIEGEADLNDVTS